MIVHRILWIADLTALGVSLVLLMPELSRERFDRDSVEIYLPVAAIVLAFLSGAYVLRRRGHLIAANLLLLVLGIPAVLFAVLAIAFTTDPTHR